jgi:hypothetical protein
VCVTHTKSVGSRRPEDPEFSGQPIRSRAEAQTPEASRAKHTNPPGWQLIFPFPPTTPQNKTKKQIKEFIAKDGESLGRSEIAEEKTLLASTKELAREKRITADRSNGQPFSRF